MLDLDQDGRVTLEEFVARYLDTRERLLEKLNETCKRIIDHKKQRDEMYEKLLQVKVIAFFCLIDLLHVANGRVHT